MELQLALELVLLVHNIVEIVMDPCIAAACMPAVVAGHIEPVAELVAVHSQVVPCTLLVAVHIAVVRIVVVRIEVGVGAVAEEQYL